MCSLLQADVHRQLPTPAGRLSAGSRCLSHTHTASTFLRPALLFAPIQSQPPPLEVPWDLTPLPLQPPQPPCQPSQNTERLTRPQAHQRSKSTGCSCRLRFWFQHFATLGSPVTPLRLSFLFSDLKPQLASPGTALGTWPSPRVSFSHGAATCAPCTACPVLSILFFILPVSPAQQLTSSYKS